LYHPREPRAQGPPHPPGLGAAVDTVYLQGDPNALYDMLVNLIRNAADASADRPAPVRIGVEREGQALHITVRDQGAASSPRISIVIFEAGFTTKEFGQGSGWASWSCTAWCGTCSAGASPLIRRSGSARP